MKTRSTFEDWMKAVDDACYRMAGVSVYDLADIPFADYYEDGMSPRGAARKAIKAEMGEDD